MNKDAKILFQHLVDAYHNNSCWISKDNLQIIEKYEKLGDVHAGLILAVDQFKKSPVVVNAQGKHIAPLTKMHIQPITYICGVLRDLEKRDSVEDLIIVPLDKFADSLVGLKCYCYRILGHIYSGAWGKIPYEYEKGKEYYQLADKCSGVESWESKLYSEEVVKERFLRVLGEQINGRTELEIISDSARRSGIIEVPTDPDLRAEYAGRNEGEDNTFNPCFDLNVTGENLSFEWIKKDLNGKNDTFYSEDVNNHAFVRSFSLDVYIIKQVATFTFHIWFKNDQREDVFVVKDVKIGDIIKKDVLVENKENKIFLHTTLKYYLK